MSPPTSGLPALPGFPRAFGPYILLGPIAQGGMGEVFLASTREIAGAVRLVVIKTLRPDLLNEPGYVRRFLDEARIVIQLQHTNICQVFDVGEHEGVHFFAMEHIAGTNLRRLIDVTECAIPTPLALLIMAEALDGLDSAHRHRHALTGAPLKVVHRDMSPHNIMLSFDGEVKLIDFGLARSELKSEQTGSQVVLGKIAYMSPEQARGEGVDAKTDQFSAAIVLYELLAGERYYGDRSQREIWQLAGSRYVPPRLGAIEPDIAVILGRALSHEPAERFESCGDFSSALRTVLKLQYPFAERATLRAFIRESLVDDRAQTEESLRTLGQLALSAALPEPAAPHTTDVTPAPEPSLPARVSRGWQPAAVAAAGGLALGAIAVFLALTAGAKPPAPAASPAPPPISPAIVADVEPAAAAATPAPQEKPAPAAAVIDKPVDKPVEPPVEKPAAEKPAAAEKPRAAVHRAQQQPDKPAWTSWSFQKKVQALPRCNASCAKTLLRLQERGAELMPGSVDACLDQCM